MQAGWDQSVDSVVACWGEVSYYAVGFSIVIGLFFLVLWFSRWMEGRRASESRSPGDSDYTAEAARGDNL